MPTLDASVAECLVFTYKEGLLSAVAHDLKLRVDRFQLKVDEATRAIAATFDATSLHAVSAMRDGAEAPGTLSRKDLRSIDDNIAKDVLETRKHKEIQFVSTSVERAGDEASVSGRLTLKGRTRAVTVPVKRDGDRWVGEITLQQPDFGVKPFSALFGTLKIKPQVTVRVIVPVSAMPWAA